MMIKGIQICIVIIGIVISFITQVDVGDKVLSTLFSVSGIMFSVGMGLVVAFNINRVKNIKYKKSIKTNLHNIRNRYIVFFSLSTLTYLLSEISCVSKEITLSLVDVNISFNFGFIAAYCIVFSIVFFIVNLISMQSLNNDIDNKLDSEI